MAVLENSVREHLNLVAHRVMAVLRPLPVTITNFPEGQVEWLEAINNPEDAAAGTRQVPFTRELLIEQEDFMEQAPRKFFRLTPGGEVRLRYGYIIRCDEVVKDAHGQVVELRCSYDPDTRSGAGDEPARKVKGTIHWVSRSHCHAAEVRLYDRLFLDETPDDAPAGKTFLDNLNPAPQSSPPRWSNCCSRPCARAINSNASATFASMPTRPLTNRFSTASCHCAIPGPNSRSSSSRRQVPTQ